MKESEIIEILKKENKELKLEVESLQKTLDLYTADKVKDTFNVLNKLKLEKEKELDECKLYKERYIKLSREMNVLKNEYYKKMKKYISAIEKI
uniref:Uncharacterized protein n=1 Tax=Siphoviridae sp. ctJLl6 TaxID=2827836 RepID=A0A8S5SC24_9CAUD|nr:MAG TPA: hypothetical protein [Siphoviridae sp. ctJLl6]